MELLGIDIGGTGIKGALVNAETGEMLTERFRIPTPSSRKPADMAKVIKQIVTHFDYSGPVGCGFPTIVKNGVCMSPGNLDKSWLGVNVDEMLTSVTGHEFTVVNDADAAGYASMNYGVGKDKNGLVIMITVGTGLGSGAFFNGVLLPNFELGQIPYKEHKKIELWAAASAKEREGLSYEKWGKRFNKFLRLVEVIVAPDLIIVGGGTSKKWKEFNQFITIETDVVKAELMNHAGIIGAAISCLKEHHHGQLS
ncbi:polyphosphate--glucose phosphotransferase [Croceitalea rosinachiae]|uniref:ROK family protein n=1 Tax=Croceitalea rosinachiae TaxID=3075596 RepID=A0ABU3AD13_9FLAO|nr:ROK family protein [Croceitalea sp. F388]MDT0608066.1 ROK family protein [Croceitalea sp. F388]